MPSPTTLRRSNDRGQVLLITALAMVVLIAIAAIVVDLGFSWMLRRHEQNAVDPGALAAAKWIRDESDPSARQLKMEAEACFYAQENGFFENDPSCQTALNLGNLEVNYPPATAMAGQYQGHFGYVEVIINESHPSFFGQFFGRPTAWVKTEAVAALTTGNANSSSLVALGGSCQPPDDGDSTVTGGGTLLIHPAAGVTAEGGYVHVNAPCGTVGDPQLCDGNGNSSALAITGGGVLEAPHVFVVGGCGTGGGGQLNCSDGSTNCLDEEAIPLGDPLAGLPEPWPTITLPVPSCPDPTDINGPNDPNPCRLSSNGSNPPCPTGVCTMEPGVYYAGWDIQGSVQVVMKPGMYVFAGYGIQMQAGAELSAVTGVDANGNLVDARVTIFSTDYTDGCLAGKPKFCEGPITLNSRGPLRLHATDDTTCQQVSPAICPWSGILLWQDGSVVNDAKDVTIAGQADLVLSGTIYAPESKVTVSGGSSGTGCFDDGDPSTEETCLAIQIIARQWVIDGGGTVDMPYDPKELYHLEQRGLVN